MEKAPREILLYFGNVFKKGRLDLNSLIGHLLREWTCWSSLNRRAKWSSYTLLGLGRIKLFPMSQVDMEEGSLKALAITWAGWLASRRGDPVSKRLWFWATRRVRQKRSNQSLSSVSERTHPCFPKKGVCQVNGIKSLTVSAKRGPQRHRDPNLTSNIMEREMDKSEQEEKNQMSRPASLLTSSPSSWGRLNWVRGKRVYDWLFKLG